MHTHLPLVFFGNLFEGPDLLVILALGILLFGRRLPEIGRNLGRSITGFKEGLKEVEGEVKEGMKETQDQPAQKVVRQVEAPRKRASVPPALPVSDEP